MLDWITEDVWQPLPELDWITEDVWPPELDWITEDVWQYLNLTGSQSVVLVWPPELDWITEDVWLVPECLTGSQKSVVLAIHSRATEQSVVLAITL